MIFVLEIKGFGAHHWSRISGLVKASHTSGSSALNSLIMHTELVDLSTVNSNFELFIFWFLTVERSVSSQLGDNATNRLQIYAQLFGFANSFTSFLVKMGGKLKQIVVGNNILLK